MSHIYCAENSSPLIRLYYATVAKRAAYRASNILTISEFTRKQIVEWSGVPSEKIFNVSCGVDPAYQPAGDNYGLPFPYLLCVSNRKRHKNEFRLIEAFSRSGLSSEIRLVFTGQSTAELSDFIERNSVTPRVFFAGLVPEEKLPALYRGAAALVFPSLYEGFGLPVLEAMACGTPVVTSNVTALPEVAGDAALLVDPTSVQQIAEAIRQIVRDTGLRRQLKDKGLSQAARFSWDATTAAVHQIMANWIHDKPH